MMFTQHRSLVEREGEMTLDDFRQSFTATELPAGLSLALAALWWDAKSDWTRAHETAQQDEGKDGSWVHAYLHPKEGDQGNAAYWYSRAGKPGCLGLEQNPQTKSRWAQMARSGKKMMQFLSEGRYVAKVVDGKVKFYHV